MCAGAVGLVLTVFTTIAVLVAEILLGLAVDGQATTSLGSESVKVPEDSFGIMVDNRTTWRYNNTAAVQSALEVSSYCVDDGAESSFRVGAAYANTEGGTSCGGDAVHVYVTPVHGGREAELAKWVNIQVKFRSAVNLIRDDTEGASVIYMRLQLARSGLRTSTRFLLQLRQRLAAEGRTFSSNPDDVISNTGIMSVFLNCAMHTRGEFRAGPSATFSGSGSLDFVNATAENLLERMRNSDLTLNVGLVGIDPVYAVEFDDRCAGLANSHCHDS